MGPLQIPAAAALRVERSAISNTASRDAGLQRHAKRNDRGTSMVTSGRQASRSSASTPSHLPCSLSSLRPVDTYTSLFERPLWRSKMDTWAQWLLLPSLCWIALYFVLWIGSFFAFGTQFDLTQSQKVILVKTTGTDLAPFRSSEQALLTCLLLPTLNVHVWMVHLHDVLFKRDPGKPGSRLAKEFAQERVAATSFWPLLAVFVWLCVEACAVYWLNGPLVGWAAGHNPIAEVVLRCWLPCKLWHSTAMVSYLMFAAVSARWDRWRIKNIITTQGM